MLHTISSTAVIWRGIVSIIGGFLLSIVCETAPYMAICTLVILLDCLSAWALGRRVKRKFPDIKKNKEHHKFDSSHFGKVVITLLKVYLLIITAYLIEQHICEGLALRLPNIAAGAVIFWQGWSILENESSCNKARWAKFAQKIFIDKSARHLDMTPEELKDLLTNKDANENIA